MLTPYQVKQIPELRKAGMNNRQIADKLGTTPGSVIRWIRQLRAIGEEIPRNKAGRPPMFPKKPLDKQHG